MKTRRTCPNGHTYYKTSDCHTCPHCVKEDIPAEGFLSLLSAPARRALQQRGIEDLQTLAKFSEKEILALHGVGPASLPVLRRVLQAAKLSFNQST